MILNISDPDIQEGLQEYEEHKKPEFDPEWGLRVGGPTLFELQESLKGEVEDFDDTTPLDEEGNLSVEWLFDFKTGELKKEMFKVIKRYQIGKNIYKIIFVEGSNRMFIVDFENRVSFPGLEKGVMSVDMVDSFGDREIIVFGGCDDTVCIDNNGRQITQDCSAIEKAKYGNIDILELTQYDYDSEKEKYSYLGSDGKRYQKQGTEFIVQKASE